MKTLLTLLAAAVISVSTVSAVRASDINTNVTNLGATAVLSVTNLPEDVTKHDLTIGGSGLNVPKTGENSSALSVSFSFDPFSSLRNLWIGAAQTVAWEPFAGSTDVDADYLICSFKDKLYLYGGWDAGIVYDFQTDPVFRTGPEFIAQYYFTDSTYLIGQYDYFLATRGNSYGAWSLGFGWEF